MIKMQDYDLIGESYDTVFSNKQQEIAFLKKTLKKLKRKRILELGSGTGIYTIPLKKSGFKIEGLEKTSEMIKVSRKKYSKLKVHKGDMQKFSFSKKFDAILALSSILILVKNHAEIVKTLFCCRKNLTPNGLLLIELPNHFVEIKQRHRKQEIFKNKDNSTIVVVQSNKTQKFWREKWHIFKTGKNGFEYKKANCDEFLYSPKKIEKLLDKTGFKIVKKYGSLSGQQLNPKTSLRRVLICQNRV